jgi:hypothetical protein
VTSIDGVERLLSDDGDDSDEDEQSEPFEADISPVWCRVPLWRVFLFSLLGGWVYQARYMYGAWGAYQASMGYSRQAQWQAVYQRTGFRVSPFWRAVLFVYAYALFIVIWREAKRAGSRSLGTPALWAGPHLLAGILPMFHVPLHWPRLLLSLTLLPVQMTVNSLGDKTAGDCRREPITGGEIVAVIVGALLTILALNRMGDV